ncbi:hypothetical protein J8273_8387 [Carpediemonas membranifera]|uniref:Uncharacterized protein n=1 Tax=Carpediemonas membranifera TaxID=201153 RepID=A0A8J6APP2_9EUKA|nr:hypothetical protein J8273_8387 [Carpediemonas membranifera]|eukprot:KAG9389713.1 hypothetical protein J8273_8387 [Carpediemonas membranifera]
MDRPLSCYSLHQKTFLDIHMILISSSDARSRFCTATHRPGHLLCQSCCSGACCNVKTPQALPDLSLRANTGSAAFNFDAPRSTQRTPAIVDMPTELVSPTQSSGRISPQSQCSSSIVPRSDGGAELTLTSRDVDGVIRTTTMVLKSIKRSPPPSQSVEGENATPVQVYRRR